jgi:hypothetical protein
MNEKMHFTIVAVEREKWWEEDLQVRIPLTTFMLECYVED